MLKKEKLHNLLNKNYIAQHPEELYKHLVLYTGHEICFWFTAILAAWFVCYLAVSFFG